MKILIIFLTIIFPGFANAKCNESLIKASSNYLLELEKAKLFEHQGDGACKVLDAEFKKCTEKQKTLLSKSFNAREVLGNICMPHLSPPPSK